MKAIDWTPEKQKDWQDSFREMIVENAKKGNGILVYRIGRDIVEENVFTGEITVIHKDAIPERTRISEKKRVFTLK